MCEALENAIKKIVEDEELPEKIKSDTIYDFRYGQHVMCDKCKRYAECFCGYKEDAEEKQE